MEEKIVSLVRIYLQCLNKKLPRETTKFEKFLQTDNKQLTAEEMSAAINEIIEETEEEIRANYQIAPLFGKDQDAVTFLKICSEFKQRLAKLASTSKIFLLAIEYEKRLLSLSASELKKLSVLLDSGQDNNQSIDYSIIKTYIRIKNSAKQQTIIESCDFFIKKAITLKLQELKQEKESGLLNILPETIIKDFLYNLAESCSEDAIKEFVDALKKDVKDFISYLQKLLNQPEGIFKGFNKNRDLKSSGQKLLKKISENCETHPQIIYDFNDQKTGTNKTRKENRDLIEKKLKGNNNNNSSLLSQLPETSLKEFLYCLAEIYPDSFSVILEEFLAKNDENFSQYIQKLTKQYYGNFSFFKKNPNLQLSSQKLLNEVKNVNKQKFDIGNKRQSLLYNLPPEILALIFNYLPRQSLYSLIRTNSKFYNITKEKNILENSFFESRSTIDPKWRWVASNKDNSGKKSAIICQLVPLFDQLILSLENNIYIKNVRTSKILKHFKGLSSLSPIAISDRWFVYARENSIIISDVRNWQIAKEIAIDNSDESIRFILLTEKKLIVICDNCIIQWDNEQWEFLDKTKIIGKPAGKVYNAIAVNEDKILLTYKTNIILWDLQKHKRESISPSSTWFMIGVNIPSSKEKTIFGLIEGNKCLARYAYEKKAWKKVESKTDLTSAGISLASSKDGSLIAIGCVDGIVRIYNSKNWQYSEVHKAKAEILHLDFLSTGELLSVDAQGSVMIYPQSFFPLPIEDNETQLSNVNYTQHL